MIFQFKDEVYARDFEATNVRADEVSQQAPSTCPKCGALKVIAGARVMVRMRGNTEASVSVGLDRNPESWFFKQTKVAELKANVCGGCGHAELFAIKPEVLSSAYEGPAQSNLNAAQSRAGD